MNLSECRRTDITIRKPQIRVIEEIEDFASELQFFPFEYANVFHRREVPIGIAGSLNNVTSFVAELLDG